MFNFLKKVTGQKSKKGKSGEENEKKNNGKGKDNGDNELLNHADTDDEFQKHEDDEDMMNVDDRGDAGNTPFVKSDIRSAMEGKLFFLLLFDHVMHVNHLYATRHIT